MDDGWMIHNRQIDIGRWIIESWQVEYRCGDSQDSRGKGAPALASVGTEKPPCGVWGHSETNELLSARAWRGWTLAFPPGVGQLCGDCPPVTQPRLQPTLCL